MRVQYGQGRVHRETWALYARSSTLMTQQIGSFGTRLRQLRDAADYDASVTFTATEVRQALTWARQALSVLDRHGYQP